MPALFEDIRTRKLEIDDLKIKYGLNYENHDLHHTYASFLLSLDINPKVVAERMGMSPQMFNNRYSHLLPTMQNEAVSLMEQSIIASQNPVKSVDN